MSANDGGPDRRATMFEAGKTYRTRDGREARVYATDGGPEWPIHGAIKRDGGEWISHNWRANGRLWNKAGDSHFDLMPPKREAWVNIYPNLSNNVFLASYLHTTRAAADEHAGTDRVACVRIEYTEGQGL